MSFISPESIAYRDDETIDAFGRLRVSNLFTTFDESSQYRSNTRDWSTLAVGTGVETHISTESAIELNTGGTAAGDGIVRQTRISWRLFPGRSTLIMLCHRFSAAAANAVARVGYFNDDDGVYLQYDTTGFRLVKRTSISGVPSDALFVAQANWNVDRFDGTGPSGVTINPQNYNTFFISIQHAFLGRITFGFIVNGKLQIAHRIDSGNTAPATLTRSANLPLRAEVRNTGVAGAPVSVVSRGSIIQVEAGDNEFSRGYLNSRSNSIAGIAVTTRRPVLSIRNSALINGIPNRGWILLYQLSTMVRSNDILWELVADGTLVGAVWTPNGGDSTADFDESATSIAGGVVLITGYTPSGAGATAVREQLEVVERYPFVINSLTGAQVPVSLVATSVAGAATAYASFKWREVF